MGKSAIRPNTTAAVLARKSWVNIQTVFAMSAVGEIPVGKTHKKTAGWGIAG